MNKNVSFYVKLVSLLLLVVAGLTPLLSAGVSSEWVGGKPEDAPADFKGEILDFRVFQFTMNRLEFNNDTKQFYFAPVDTSNKTDDFVAAMTGFQTLLKILYLIAFAGILTGTIIHFKKKSKLASFLIILGILAIIVIVLLITAFQKIALESLSAERGVLQGNKVIIDNQVEINGDTYTWRNTITLALGTGLYLLSLSGILALVSLFLKGEYSEPMTEKYED